MADTVINIADIINQFGDYYLNSGQNLASIRQKLYYGFESAQDFTLMPTDDTIIRLSESEIGEVLQPYQDTFTPKGTLNFKPFKLILEQIKIDQAFNPNKLVKSWLGFLTSNNLERETWPFIKWFIEVKLIPAILQDMEKKVIFSGVFAAPADGVAGNAADSMNGVRKVLNDLIVAGDIVPIATGAFADAPADFVTQIEEFCASIPENHWNMNMTLKMSHTLARRFRQGMRTKYNKFYAQESDLNMIADFGIAVAGRYSHAGSSKIWMAHKENAIMGTKAAANMSLFGIEAVDRKVKIYSDWFAGVGFVIPGEVFTNDQDLV